VACNESLDVQLISAPLGGVPRGTMNNTITLHFESKLKAPRERVWDWITSIEGISTEMRPFFHMTTPRGVRSIADLHIEPGVRMFRSCISLFGFIPIGYSDMTLVELDPGHGFVEQSPMASMQFWRHERRIVPCLSVEDAVLLVDSITFRPRIAIRLVGRFMRLVFAHRHRVLRTNLGGM
jgi:ligand-binding SRPBCC domain-containing protein